ncbi:NYN domain-containing protein [bacterium]|nr:NYN domain-containing protein [bacterium]
MSTKQQYIIDGYNMIHRIERYRSLLVTSLESARQGLLLQLSNFRVRTSVEISVVFDGQKLSQQKTYGIKVYYSDRPNNADDFIKGLVDTLKHRNMVTVVSSDKEVMWYAKNSGCGVVSAENFQSRLEQAKSHSTVNEEIGGKSNPNLSSKEIDEWMKLFNQKP